MFVVSLTYLVALSEVEIHLPAHITYLEAQYTAGHFLASGRKEPRTGGVILALVDSREVLEHILDFDPFKQNGIAHYDVIEFMPTKTAPELEFLRVSA
ncbi:YciI family protein [uncultured Shewanella sp.]|uniref:YciI family protein n=1 Tax=uncultured Shewanella sp. TaxID=173975 RepID=UPI002633B950|nr:YciI family protein [uncultured Shewanella sp.]